MVSKPSDTATESRPALAPEIGVLLSGGLDSSILIGHLLAQGRLVQPFYIQCGLYWENTELAAARSFLRVLPTTSLRNLVTLALPLDDVYQGHWSITGRDIPNADSPDEAVFLPGRNALLIIKAAIWCQLHGVEQLALAPLASNPFSDASDPFFAHLQSALSYTGRRLEILRPFGNLKKTQVMHLGRDLPLELTFSCISPLHGVHCGRCNKCAERKQAFVAAEMTDPTRYDK